MTRARTRARELRLVAGIAAAIVVTLLTPVAAPAASLEQRIDSVVRSSGVGSTSSVYVWDQTTRDVLYTHASARAMTPASTMKLLTGAAALSRLGADHRFTTRLALVGTQQGDRFIGDVWLVGGGDPSLSTFGFARRNYAGRGANLASLVAPLRARGIRGVTGDIRVDDDLFDGVRWVPEWKRAFRFEETGALGALTVNQSLLGNYVGTQSSYLPDVHAGEVYRDLLRRQGIFVAGRTVGGSVPGSAEFVGAVSSPPLATLLAHMSTASDNFFAEILLKQVGVDWYGARSDGSTSQGRRAAMAQLRELGIDMDGVTWHDGSGLAYGNRLTARTLGHVLGVGAQAEWGPTWIAGFANSGRSGTLRNRMTRRPWYGRVFAKTGTLNHTSGLAGFAYRLGSNHPYGFAVLTTNANGASVSYTRARGLQDRVAMTLVR